MKILIAVVLVLCAVPAWAANTYYVSNSGSDSNSCSAATNINTPKANIGGSAGVIPCLAAGDTAYIRGGSYGSIQWSAQTMNNGTSWSVPITLSAYQNEVVNVQNIGFTGGNTAYWIFNGLKIDGTNLGGDELIYISGGTTNHIRFTNMEVYNSRSNGVLTGCGTGPTEIINSNFHDIARIGDATGTFNVAQGMGRGHAIYDYGTDLLVQGTTITRVGEYGIQIYTGGQCTVSNPKILGNTISHTGQNTTRYGAPCCGAMTIWYAANALVANNVLYDNFNASGSGHGIEVDASSTGTLIYNNTVYHNGPSNGIEFRATTGAIDNNIIYANTTQDIRNLGGITLGTHNVSTDPHFVSTSTPDFHLTSASTNCIDVGANYTTAGVTVDKDNLPRPQGPGFDIGAYELPVSTSGCNP